MVVEKVDRRGGLDGVYGLVEGRDREALVAAGEGIGRVDVAVAGEAERGGVGLAGDVRGRLLAYLAERYARVARGELVGGVDLRVAGSAEEGGVRAAVQGGGGGLA